MSDFLRGLDALILADALRDHGSAPPTCELCGALLSEVEAAGRTSGKCNECLRDKNEYPRVGDAATIGYWSDRHAATVVYVSPSFKTIRVQRDNAKLVSGNIQSESQQYEYEPNPYGTITTARRTKRGYTAAGGSPRVYVGRRNEYRDPSY